MIPIPPQMLEQWIENLAINSCHELKDISEWRLPPDRDPPTRVIIAGSGPSAVALYDTNIHRSKTLILSNQSSLRPDPDIVVVTDPNIPTLEKLTRLHGTLTVFAATITSPWIAHQFSSTYHFILPTNDQGDPALAAINTLMRIMAPSLHTFVVQTGCSLNTAVIIAMDLMDRGVIPKVPIHLVGMDCAYETPKRKRSDDFVDPDPMIHDHRGYLTSQALVAYAGGLKKIIEGSPGFEFYCEPAQYSLIREFVEQRSVLDA